MRSDGHKIAIRILRQWTKEHGIVMEPIVAADLVMRIAKVLDFVISAHDGQVADKIEVWRILAAAK